MSRSSTPRRSHRPTAVRQLDVEPIDGGLPFHRVVAALQERVAGGATSVVVSGSNAAAVASRLVRLLGGGVDVVVRLAPVTNDDDAARAARDAVALAGIAGGRASVEVETGLAGPAARRGPGGTALARRRRHPLRGRPVHLAAAPAVAGRGRRPRRPPPPPPRRLTWPPTPSSHPAPPTPAPHPADFVPRACRLRTAGPLSSYLQRDSAGRTYEVSGQNVRSERTGGYELSGRGSGMMGR